MNENVNIYIEGIVSGEDESRITTNAIGDYRLVDGVHILRYEESVVDKDCVNTIKMSPGRVEMIKSGESSTHMSFDTDKGTESVYETPYGCLYFQVSTKRIHIEEMEKEITLHMDYSLSHDDSYISDNRIKIVVRKI